MFVLAEIKDTVRVKPWHFGQDLREAIATKLNKKLANKVSGQEKCLNLIRAWFRLCKFQLKLITVKSKP